MTELAKSFEPIAIEARWTPLWEASGAYAPTLDPTRPSFSIQLPPPNVTGTLHMGHAFNQTIMDALTRWHRMRGFNTLWLDHHAADAAHGRQRELGTRVLHDRCEAVAGGHRDLRAAVRGRADLPRQAAGQPGPGAEVGRLRTA